MKFLRQATAKGLRILPAELKTAGFPENAEAETHVLDDVIVVLKRRMTGMELIRAARRLHELSVELNVQLAKTCGFCHDCAQVCPFEELEEEIGLPDFLREEAGIDEGAKLCAYVNEEENSVTIVQADHQYDLRDVPPEVLDMFLDTGLCLGELDELLIKGDIVYEG
ncbi:hypothetical protein DWV16_00330 [Anaerotruncus sp. AF02-27]|uniref:hypothetical protein n=1 Tax=Anaerotruncus sp. AF02-27 TaxID=2292191 RepID=UPI000E528508|nr:hypothetical protein [Anaerotruncus sp. AF02-27]RGX56805.1 hypothetical protein DWV16_00330 [Anaerotruncus sp. AF02-27]